MTTTTIADCRVTKERGDERHLGNFFKPFDNNNDDDDNESKTPRVHGRRANMWHQDRCVQGRLDALSNQPAGRCCGTLEAQEAPARMPPEQVNYRSGESKRNLGQFANSRRTAVRCTALTVMGARVPMTSSRVSYGCPLHASIVSPGLKTPKRAQAMACVPLKHCTLTCAHARVPGRRARGWERAAA